MRSQGLACWLRFYSKYELRKGKKMADTTLMGDSSEAQQYLDTFRRAEYLEPEKALIAAILEDAIHEYHKYRDARDAAGKERFREAEEWIMHEGDEWIFSFDNVCEFLGLDPEYLRRGLLEMDRHGSGTRAA
jgi:hypothetical protein